MKDIVIKGKYIIHGIYLFIIVILIVLLFAEVYKIRICVNPDKTKTATTSSTPKIVDIGTGRAVQTSTPSTTTSTSSQTTTQNTTSTSSNQDNESDEPPSEPETADPGVIKFTITDIEYEIKGDDWATVTSIEYKIENGKEDFYPLIQVYLFDSNDPEDIKSLVQDTIELPLLEEGEVITKASTVHISYNEINREKTLRLVLRNELGKELKVAVKKYDTD
ncbi:hypothetical protein KY331_04665 [Candidatus Woesearchaeota archaeon]|nr:hypothetical protein [Candidatus Woesearchaeota archaeon]